MPVVEKMVPNPRLTEMALDSLRYQGAFQEQQAARLLSLAAHQKEVVKEPDREALQGFLMNFVKVTKFDVSPENTFYREREWRNIGDFSFAFDDVAAVVVTFICVASIIPFIGLAIAFEVIVQFARTHVAPTE